jgi:hypothetical protein
MTKTITPAWKFEQVFLFSPGEEAAAYEAKEDSLYRLRLAPAIHVEGSDERPGHTLFTALHQDVPLDQIEAALRAVAGPVSARGGKFTHTTFGGAATRNDELSAALEEATAAVLAEPVKTLQDSAEEEASADDAA